MSGLTETEVAYPASWWESQSAEQLQEYVRAGFASGAMFDGAHRELERRARDAASRIDAAAKDEIQHHVDQQNWIALIAATVSLLIATGVLIWMLMAR